MEVNSENDDMNDAIILSGTSVTHKTFGRNETETEQSKLNPSTSVTEDKEPKSDESKDGRESKGDLNKQESNLEKFEKTYEFEPAMKIEKGMMINFLTGEEEKMEETGEFFTITELNEGRLEETSVAVTESEISCIETDVSDYKSLAEDRTISSISVMEVDDEPYDSSKNPLNEQILDDTIRLPKTSVSSSEMEDIRNTPSCSETHDNLKTPESQKNNSERLNIPILIVSPPEEFESEAESNEPDEKIAEKSERQEKEDSQKRKQSAEDSKPTSSKQALETQSSDEAMEAKILDESVEKPHPENIPQSKEDDLPTSTEDDAKMDLFAEKTMKKLAKSSPTKSKSSQPVVLVGIQRGSPEFDKKIEAAESTVQDIELENKLKVSADEISVGPENKKSKTSSESPLKKKTSDRNILDVASTTPSSSRSLRTRRSRSESIDIDTKPVAESNSPSLQRITRATSVPRTDSNITPRQRKLRRLSESSSSVPSPTRILTRRQSLLLERIEEGNILDSPSSRTRSQKRLNSNDSEPDTSSPTMNKQSRRYSASGTDTPDLKGTPRRLRAKSVLSEDNEQTTPRRNRMSFSKEVLEDSRASKYRNYSESAESSESSEEETPKKSDGAKKATIKSKLGKKAISDKDTENTSKSGERQEKGKTQKTKKATRSVSSKNLDESENSESEMSDSDEVVSHKSSVSSKRSSTKNTKTTTGKLGPRSRKESEDINAGGDMHNSSFSEDISSSRRVTRNQKYVIEKNMSSPAPEPRKITRRRVSKTDGSPVKKTDRDSEVESIASGRSRMSTDSKKRVTRNSAKEDADETSSIASSTRSRKSNRSRKEEGHTKTTRDKNLTAIPEDQEQDLSIEVSSDEEMETSPKEVPKKRGRAKKSSK